MTESANYVGNIRQFQLHTSDWSVYKPHLFNYFVANEINNSVKKRAIFLNVLDEESYKLITSLCHPILPENTTFSALMLLFDGQFAPQKSVFMERYKFYNAVMHKGESVKDWAARVQHLAAPCRFGSELEVCQRDKFVFGFDENFFNLLEDDVNISFEEAVKLAQQNYDQNRDKGTSPSSLYSMFEDYFCPFSRYIQSPHLCNLYWYHKYAFPINCDYFY
ncbi:hypothetical protein NQ314_004301 [Rhamnusium bicolor]|uniref:Uncharacterized protein n=1 Tax=Rhamnusium bicolor TaxID=1586634 RepID=A0AAV8ZLW1_9CUCU|nr:hypothetical protein NQ314_004301 [Rhamnusium bicolor]